VGDTTERHLVDHCLIEGTLSAITDFFASILSATTASDLQVANCVMAQTPCRPSRRSVEWAFTGILPPRSIGYVDASDSACAVMADFADLKSPWTRGYSREVAELADAAAREMGWFPTRQNG
jgi:hypothetical protein